MTTQQIADIKFFTPDVIREIRTKLDMTQEEFSEYLGVGGATVPRWENDYNKPSKYTLPALRRAAKRVGLI